MVYPENTMGRQALHGERPSDPHFLFVFVRLVKEVLEISARSDRGVDLVLTRDPLLPPLGVCLLGFLRPVVFGLVRDVPLLPIHAEHGVEVLTECLEVVLEVLPDDVDLGVVPRLS